MLTSISSNLKKHFYSDHRPVYGIFKISSFPSLTTLSFPPFSQLFREALLKFHSVILDYNWNMLEKIPGDNLNINYPFEISFNFIAPFLNNSPCSAGITVDKDEEKGVLLWREDMVPIIFTSIGEKEFLREKKLILTVMLGEKDKTTEMMIGLFL